MNKLTNQDLLTTVKPISHNEITIMKNTIKLMAQNIYNDHRGRCENNISECDLHRFEFEQWRKYHLDSIIYENSYEVCLNLH